MLRSGSAVRILVHSERSRSLIPRKGATSDNPTHRHMVKQRSGYSRLGRSDSLQMFDFESGLPRARSQARLGNARMPFNESVGVEPMAASETASTLQWSRIKDSQQLSGENTLMFVQCARLRCRTLPSMSTLVMLRHQLKFNVCTAPNADTSRRRWQDDRSNTDTAPNADTSLTLLFRRVRWNTAPRDDTSKRFSHPERLSVCIARKGVTSVILLHPSRSNVCVRVDDPRSESASLSIDGQNDKSIFPWEKENESTNLGVVHVHNTLKIAQMMANSASIASQPNTGRNVQEKPPNVWLEARSKAGLHSLSATV
eukprot:m.397471 g.397471  ORF g.397471 m.397471 type:complete len:313 (-) comp21130_c0_seq1:1389-2327(-)